MILTEKECSYIKNNVKFLSIVQKIIIQAVHFYSTYGIIDNVKRLYKVLILCDTILILKNLIEQNNMDMRYKTLN